MHRSLLAQVNFHCSRYPLKFLCISRFSQFLYRTVLNNRVYSIWEIESLAIYFPVYPNFSSNSTFTNNKYMFTASFLFPFSSYFFVKLRSMPLLKYSLSQEEVFLELHLRVWIIHIIGVSNFFISLCHFTRWFKKIYISPILEKHFVASVLLKFWETSFITLSKGNLQ